MVGSSDTVEAMNGASEAAAPVSDYYIWRVPGKPVAVHLRFDVIDRLQLEVMRGFGAVPRRGAEIGGVLLGHSLEGEPATVYIDDFEVVQCEYRNGPTFQLSETDLIQFDQVLERWKPEASPALYPVGFYRSTTRDELALTGDDLALFNSRYSASSSVILQIKPFATRVSVGGFFFREGDSIHSESTYLEFPFRRKDLGGGSSTRPRRQDRGEPPAPLFEDPAMEPTPDAPLPASRLELPAEPIDAVFSAERSEREPASGATPAPAAQKTSQKTNVWIPLSFIFLLLGVLLGFQMAISTRTPATAGLSNPYALGLQLTRNGDNVHIRWDHGSPAIRAARRGVLSISDGAINKTVDLNSATLQNGSVIYRHVSDALSFRLEVYPAENTSVTESLQATMQRIPAEMPARPER